MSPPDRCFCAVTLSCIALLSAFHAEPAAVLACDCAAALLAVRRNKPVASSGRSLSFESPLKLPFKGRFCSSFTRGAPAVVWKQRAPRQRGASLLPAPWRGCACVPTAGPAGLRAGPLRLPSFLRQHVVTRENASRVNDKHDWEMSPLAV